MKNLVKKFQKVLLYEYDFEFGRTFTSRFVIVLSFLLVLFGCFGCLGSGKYWEVKVRYDQVSTKQL